MKNNKNDNEILDINIIKDLILVVRGKKVMLDKDLAMLYEVPTKVLKQSVKRNKDRFPDDFMFLLTKEESDLFSRSQIVTLKIKQGNNIKYNPLVFTEQGIAMLSSVLRSPKAIQINIQIIRIFTKLREMINAYAELREKVEEMEKSNETNFREIFRVIRMIIKQEEKPKAKIGFNTGIKNKK